MPSFFSSPSSSSANTIRPGRLHVRSRRSRKGRRSISWPFSAQDIRRHIFHPNDHRPRSDEDGDGQADGNTVPSHKHAASGGLKGALKTLGRTGHRKSVTIEERHGGRGGATSDEGTVRRGNKEGVLSYGDDVDDEDTWIRVGSHTGAHYGEYLAVPGDVEQNVPKLVLPEVPDEHTHHKRMRTVSRDDYLTARGANPRTGVVSPSITDSSTRPSTDHERHYDRPRRQLSASKWRTRGDQWVSIDADQKTPMPSPDEEVQDNPHRGQTAEERAQGYRDILNGTTSKLEDKFVVNMPSARDPNPPTMTNEQIIAFQQSVERQRRHGGYLVDPNTPPTPRVETPRGPSTPPNRLARKFPPNFMGREPRWSNDYLANLNEKGEQKAEAKDQEHVHFARPPADSGQRNGSANQQPRRKLYQIPPASFARQPFLGEQEARGKQQDPVYQSLNALLSHSPPSTRGMQTVKDSQGVQPQQPLEDVTTPNENCPDRQIDQETLFQRRSVTNMQKLALGAPMRIPIPEQPKKENANITITTTSTMLRRKPVPRDNVDQSTVNRPGEMPVSPDYMYISSFPYLPRGQDIGPRIQHIGDDDIKETGAEKAHQRPVTFQQGVKDQKGVYGNAGCTPIPRSTSRRIQWIGGAVPLAPEETVRFSSPGYTIRDFRDTQTHASDETASLSSEELISGHDDKPANFPTRLHVIAVAAVLLLLDIATYFCDTARAILRSDANGAAVREPSEDEMPGEVDRQVPEVTPSRGWASVMFDVVVAIGLVLLVHKLLECVSDFGDWANLAVAMGT